jgi:hypothetical protein
MHIDLHISPRSVVGFAAVGIAFAAIGVARAAIPDPSTSLVYTGFLENNGAPVTAAQNVDVVLHKTATDTSASDALCTTSKTQLAFDNGRFAVALDASCAPQVRSNANIFVEVKVNGAPVGARTPIGAVPFAVEAEHADSADSATNATNATSATNANHASSADNATNANHALSADSVANGAIGPAQAPFAPTVDSLSSPHIASFSTVVNMSPNPIANDVADFDVGVAGFSSTMNCVAWNGDGAANARKFVELLGQSPGDIQVRVVSMEGAIPDGLPFRLNGICVGN